MSSLEEQAFRYLPRTLIEYWAENPDVRPVWGQWLHGSLMHCDVTGFTAMSEKLAETGKEGAELMAGVLNQFFERMLAIAVSWGGIQMKFGGDAMLLYFPESDHAARATACGLEMQSAMREFSRVKVKADYHKLKMRIGVHSGRFFACSVGQTGTRIGQGEGLLHYFLVGHDVNQAADTEPMAEPGQVVVSQATNDILVGSNQDNKLYSTDHEGIFLAKKIFAKKKRLQYFDDSALPHHVLSRYMMKPIADGLITGQSEHRRVTIIFIYVTGIAELLKKNNDTEAIEQINRYTNLVFKTAEKYGGHFAASDASEHGDKLIVLFGAPVLQDSQESSAMHFALELKNQLPQLNLELRQHIGINTGYVFCGEIGSSMRREYTVIGDSVNLSARLMTAARENEIILSRFTYKNYQDEFLIEKLEPIRVKGKKDLIEIGRLDDIGSDDGLVSIHSPAFIGRIAELESIQQKFSTINTATSSVELRGEAGIGKTAIANEFIKSLPENVQCINAVSRAFDKSSPYSSINQILLAIFNINDISREDEATESIKRIIEKYIPHMKIFIPLIQEMLGMENISTTLASSLDAKTRREKRVETVLELLKSLSNVKSIAILFDNVQWVDELSLEIIHAIRSIKNNLFLLLTLRSEINDNNEPVFYDDTHEVIDIDTLSDQDSIKLISSLVSNAEDDFLVKIHARTQGHPLFITEMINSLDSTSGELPDSLYDIVMMKMDKLLASDKILLQRLSVVGEQFPIDDIEPVLNRS